MAGTIVLTTAGAWSEPASPLSLAIDAAGALTLAGQTVAASNAAVTDLQPSDLEYLGAFLLPTTTFFEAMGEQGYPQTASMTFCPTGNSNAGSLFIIGRQGRVAEVTIPTAKTSALNTATVIQSNSDPFAYSSAGDNDATAGICYMPAKGSQSTAKLYFGSFEYYNTDGTDYNSLGWANTDLSNTQTAGLWHVGSAASSQDDWNHGVKHGEYMFAVPQDWADTHTDGRSLIVGRTREAAGAGGSSGPVMIAVAPWASGNPPSAGTALPATPLSYFYTNIVTQEGSSTNWQSWRMYGDPDWTYWSPKDRVSGGAWVEVDGKRAVVLAMTHGLFDNDPAQPKYGSDGSHGGFDDDPTGQTAPFCYGDGGTQCAYGIAISNNKGYHCGPYAARLAFVSVDDLESVAAETKDPRTMTAYAVYDLMDDFGTPSGTTTDRTGSNDTLGCAFDEATGRLYVGQANGNDPNGHPNPAWPVIHVYQVT